MGMDDYLHLLQGQPDHFMDPVELNAPEGHINLFTDGACLTAKHPWLALAGWAVHCLEMDTVVAAGPLGGGHRSGGDHWNYSGLQLGRSPAQASQHLDGQSGLL